MQPTTVYRHRNNNIAVEQYCKDGLLHRTDGPARIRYYANKRIHEQAYYVNGVPHREDAPQRVSLFGSGKLHEEEWKVNGLSHRIGEPAYIRYENRTRYHSYRLAYRGWYFHGLHHNWDGPASVFSDHDGDYYLFGLGMKEQRFNELVRTDRMEACRQIIQLKTIDYTLPSDFHELFNNAIFQELLPIDPVIAQNVFTALQIS